MVGETSVFETAWECAFFARMYEWLVEVEGPIADSEVRWLLDTVVEQLSHKVNERCEWVSVNDGVR